jgi:hypothetical protein
MVNVMSPKLKVITAEDNTHYEYMLAVSSDTLYVISPDKTRLVEIINDGTDINGYLLSAESEDEFLDTILRIKQDICSGYNPLLWILK